MSNWSNVQPLFSILEFRKVVSGRPCNSYRDIFLGNLTWKKFENWSTFAEVMIKSQVYWFFWDTLYIWTDNTTVHRNQMYYVTSYRHWCTAGPSQKPMLRSTMNCALALWLERLSLKQHNAMSAFDSIREKQKKNNRKKNTFLQFTQLDLFKYSL